MTIARSSGLPPDSFQLVFQYAWVPLLLFVLGLAAAWRVAARHRIAADPSLRQPLNRLYGGFAFWLSLPFLVMGAGILSGSVETVFHFLRFDLANPFIAAFYLLAVVEDALFIYWIFLRDGDQLLALHSELPVQSPRFRLIVRGFALLVPVSQVWSVVQVTTSPHFGQFLGA
jgi:hypothetical protein